VVGSGSGSSPALGSAVGTGSSVEVGLAESVEAGLGDPELVP
jgi:hypothetical protein